jgi:hypothetical protein
MSDMVFKYYLGTSYDQFCLFGNQSKDCRTKFREYQPFPGNEDNNERHFLKSKQPQLIGS